MYFFLTGAKWRRSNEVRRFTMARCIVLVGKMLAVLTRRLVIWSHQGKMKFLMNMFVKMQFVVVLKLPMPTYRTAKVVAPVRCPQFQLEGMAEKPHLVIFYHLRRKTRDMPSSCYYDAGPV